jgi:hypothetical protein
MCHYNFTLASRAACPTPVSDPSPPRPLPPGPAVALDGRPGPFAPYVCDRIQLVDDAGGTWAFSFSQLYQPDADYAWQLPSGVNLSINVCGNANSLCAPEFTVPISSGAAVTFSWPPPVGDKFCPTAWGDFVPCTYNCYVAASGAPLWSLTDPANGATGGVTAAYAVVLPSGKHTAVGMHRDTRAVVHRLCCNLRQLRVRGTNTSLGVYDAVTLAHRSLPRLQGAPFLHAREVRALAGCQCKMLPWCSLAMLACPRPSWW